MYYINILALVFILFVNRVWQSNIKSTDFKNQKEKILQRISEIHKNHHKCDHAKQDFGLLNIDNKNELIEKYK